MLLLRSETPARLARLADDFRQTRNTAPATPRKEKSRTRKAMLRISSEAHVGIFTSPPPLLAVGPAAGCTAVGERVMGAEVVGEEVTGAFVGALVGGARVGGDV
jgi:hypothetical protein